MAGGKRPEDGVELVEVDLGFAWGGERGEAAGVSGGAPPDCRAIDVECVAESAVASGVSVEESALLLFAVKADRAWVRVGVECVDPPLYARSKVAEAAVSAVGMTVV